MQLKVTRCKQCKTSKDGKPRTLRQSRMMAFEKTITSDFGNLLDEQLVMYRFNRLESNKSSRARALEETARLKRIIRKEEGEL